MTKRKTTEEYILEARSVHGDRYDYSKTDYRGNKQHCLFICRVHGEFSQAPYEHLHSRGCRKCSAQSSAIKRRLDLTEFIHRATELHAGFYSYAKATQSNSNRDKVVITCPTHGDFEQTVSSHLSGKGCTKCALLRQASNQTFTQEQAINRFKLAHGDRYDYSLTTYENTYKKVKIICNSHGEFEQNPVNHWNGAGCRKCYDERNSTKMAKDTAWFITQASKLHAGKYDYTNVVYTGSKKPVKISCEKGHEFEQRPNDHLTGHGCPVCLGVGPSAPEEEIRHYLESIGISCIASDRKVLKGKEIDLLCGDIGIEFNGLYWHSEAAGKHVRYHKEKTELAKAAGIKLVHIFEDEWLEKKEVVKSRLAAKFGKSTRSYARKMQVRELAWKEAKAFYTENHLQDAGQAGKSLGLYLEGVLMACFTVGRRNNVHELLRYASIGTVVGGFSKLFNAFIKANPEITRIISYSDLRWGEGAVYGGNGFKRLADTVPGYFWCKKAVRYPRQMFQKHKLSAILDKFDAELTEAENMAAHNYYRIFDCGHAKWEWMRNA